MVSLYQKMHWRSWRKKKRRLEKKQKDKPNWWENCMTHFQFFQPQTLYGSMASGVTELFYHFAITACWTWEYYSYLDYNLLCFCVLLLFFCFFFGGGGAAEVGILFMVDFTITIYEHCHMGLDKVIFMHFLPKYRNKAHIFKCILKWFSVQLTEQFGTST